ncbi:hypothetical protein BDR07DRAFT_1373763 [Suillus spraguei]|nr:hypothetical protein BDR07DRAFT_1373763 [Suillus spraguei]
MPTIPYPLALIQLWIANPTLPWSNPVWQSLTQVLGDPWAYDCSMDVTAAAAHVAEWTVGKAQAIEVFMNNCKTAQDPAEHYASKCKDNDHEGRSSWNAWIKTVWAKWKINRLVDNILQENGCKPHEVMARLNCKTADEVRHAASIKLADALFSDDAFTDGSFIVLSIMTFVTTMLVSTWNRYRKVIKRQANSIDKKTQEVEEQWLAITAANASPTMASIRMYLKKLESLVTLLSVFRDQEMAKKLEARRDQVNAMLAAAKKDPTKAELIEYALDRLATEEEVKELELLIETTLAAMAPLEGDEVMVDFEENMTVNDWKSGVEEYDRCSEGDLWEHLGLSEKKLPFFQVRSDPDAAIDLWSEEGQQWLDNPTSPTQNLAPRWHQLVGILRLIDRVLDCKPVMLMDGIGVGKTMQAVGLIACLAHYREYYRKHGKFPGKFAQWFHKKTGNNIPDLPVVIMSPPNLQHQWMNEIQWYLRQATFDVLPYVGKYTTRVQWWTMAWSKCQQPPIQHIILATMSAAQDDAATVFIQGNRDSYGQPLPSPRFQRTSPNTLFGHEYVMSIADEGHMLHNINMAHTAARALQGKSHSTVVMTATPVTTKPVDLWNMGLLLGLQQFKSIAQLKTMNRELSAAQRRDHKAQRKAGVEGSILRAVFVGNQNPEAAQEEYLPVMKEWMGQMREWFAPAVILRTVDSTDNTGNKILGLPPYHDHSLKINLLDWEMEKLRNIVRGYLDECPIVGMSKNYHVEFRRSILHPHMNSTEERSWTKPKSREEWDTNPDTKSMKLDVLAMLLKYHLESDGRQPLIMDESGRNLVPNTAFTAGNTNPDEPDRVVVFSAFVTSNQVIVDILDLYGIRVLELNGQTPMRKCKDILDEFRSSSRTDGVRVLILSRVGMIGLNLACANIMVVMGAMHEAFIGADKEFRKGYIFEDDDGAMGDLISVGPLMPKFDDSVDDSDIVDVDVQPIRNIKVGKKKARTKATAKTPLSPTRLATKRKGKASKVKSKAVETDKEFEGASRKRRKGIESLLHPITKKGVPDITSRTIAAQESLDETQSLPQPKASSVGLESRDDHNLLNSSSQPSSPSPISPASPLGHLILSSTVPTPIAASAKSSQPPDVPDGCARSVSEKEPTDFGHEMDNSSHNWNGGGNHASQLAGIRDEQPPRQDHCPSTAFDNVFNKRHLALSSKTFAASSPVGSSPIEAVASRILTQSEATLIPPTNNQRPRPHPRPRIPKPGTSSVNGAQPMMRDLSQLMLVLLISQDKPSALSN